MAKRESLYHRYPNYRVDLKPLEERVRVHWDGKLLADSSRALLVLETDHDPVIYLPREDVSFGAPRVDGSRDVLPVQGRSVVLERPLRRARRREPGLELRRPV